MNDYLDLNSQIQKVLPESVNIDDIKETQNCKTYTFSTQKDDIIKSANISFFYDKKGNITKINPKENDEFTKSLIECFSDISLLFKSIEPPLYKFPKNSLEDLFNRIKNKLKNDIKLNYPPKDLHYRQRYTFTQGGLIAVFDVLYKKDGKITSISSVPKHSNSTELVEQIKKIIKDS